MKITSNNGKNQKERKIIGQTIETEANNEIIDSHIYLDNARFQIRNKETPVVCKNVKIFLQFGHLKNYCHWERQNYEKCTRGIRIQIQRDKLVNNWTS